MNDITYAVSVDVNNPTIPYNAYVASVLDSNVRYLEITLYQNGNVIALSNTATATASLVTDNVLVDDSVNCTISDNIITVPLEDLQRHGNLDVQVTVTEGTKALAIPFPIQVRVTPNIAEEAQIDENSMGSYAEVVQEIADARRGYNSLNERINNAAAPTDEQVAEAVSDYFDEHPISGAEKFVEVTDTSDTAVDNCTDPDTVYIVRVVSGVVTTTKMRVICTPNVAGQMAQYAMTKDGYIISRKFTATVWGAWDYIPDSKRVASMISTAIAGKADSSAIPTKTSQLNNDSGFLTSHQDISGKADKSTTLSGYGITNAYTKTEVDNALSSKADSSAIPTKTSQLNNDSGFLTSHQDISGKADKSTTLAGYGITDAYTKSEVDALVSGGVIPQYVIDESESVLAKAFAHKGLGRTIRFIAVSDSHNDATKISHDYTRVSNMHCGQAVKYIADRIPLDFVASLGDMTWAGVVHTTAQYQTDWLKADIQEMNMFLKDGFSGIPNIRVVGNHDQCATTDSGGTVSRLQNNGAYQYFGRYNAGVNDGLSNYGYYDIDNVKLRIIYLNTSDTVSTSTQGTLLGVSQEQKNWLCETLIDINSKSDAADWKILLLSHAPLDMVSGIAADILIPYTNGGTYSGYTFTNHNAKIIGNCHGHTHCYRVDYMADKIRRFTIPNSNFYDNNHYKNNTNYSAWNEDTTYPKTENSRTDTSFSLVTIDLDNDMCYIDNYGAGYDRAFNVDYKKAVSSISNLSYTGTTTVGQNIDISAISYTVIYSDGSTSLRTGDVTVSPVTIQQVGNNAVTVSYTENGTTVTGTLTITGTAPPVTRLLDLDRTEATAAVDALIPFDTTKYYKNISNGTAKGYGTNCTVYSKTSDSISLKESGTGGITVGYPVELPDTSGSYTFSCDYNGTGRARIYYRIFDSSGTQLTLPSYVITNDSAVSGSVSATIAAPGGNYKWLIIMFGSSTNGSKEYTNVSLTENN